MKIFIKHYSAYLGAIMVASFIALCSCGEEITRYLYAPTWIEVNKVSSRRIDLRWESKEAEQYIVYKVFEDSYSSARSKIKYYASQYEVARTTVPEYQYKGSYNPVENGYPSYYDCYFGVRVVDENGNMSNIKIERVY